MPIKSTDEPTAEVTTVVHKQTCPQCKGNRVIMVKGPKEKPVAVKCPSCGGQGYKISISR